MIDDGGHWYHPDGYLVESVPYAKPKVLVDGTIQTHRPPTLRDAKKMGFYRSWSTIAKAFHKRELDDYWREHYITAAWETPRDSKIDWLDWREQVMGSASEHARAAREAGSSLHAEIEGYYLTKDPPFLPVAACAVSEIEAWRQREQLEWPESEKAWVHHPTKTGGKIDLLFGNGVLADIKTTSEKSDSWPYIEWGGQLAFYARGTEMRCRLINLVIARESGRLLRVVEWGVNEEPGPEKLLRWADALDYVWMGANGWPNETHQARVLPILYRLRRTLTLWLRSGAKRRTIA